MAADPPARILVVDDNPQNVLLIKAQLERAGFLVSTAASGLEGIQVANSEQPDLILLDILMPGMDGYETCRQLKANPTTRAVPIAMLTALHEQADKVQALEAGADDFLSKPVDRAELLTRVRSLLRIKRLYDEVANSRDEITRQAEALREAQRRLGHLLSLSPAVIFSLEPFGDRPVIYMSENAQEVLGYSAATFLADPTFWRAQVHPDDAPSLFAGDPVLAERGSLSYEYRFRQSDGSYRWFQDSLRLVSDAHGKPTEIIGIALDITERKRSEEKLSESQRQLAEAQRIARLGSWELDVVTGLASCSEELYRIYGLEQQPRESSLRPMLEHIHPDDRGKVLAAIETARQSPQPIDIDHRIVRSDGTIRAVHTQGRVRTDEQGNGVRVFGTVQDITERVQAEEERNRLLAAVDRERATLASIMSSMTDGLVVLDAGGQIRYANAKAGALLGIDPSDFTGRSVATAVADIASTLHDPAGAWSAWQQALANVASLPSFELHRSTPPVRDLMVQFFPVHNDLEASAEADIGVLLHDVTTERDLQRTKDELVAVVSHELRTPLASLVGFAELLLMRDYPKPQRREFLQIMYEEGQRLTALINDFLDLQRMEGGRQSVQPVTTDPRSLLEHALATAGDDPKRPIVLDFPNVDLAVRADPDRIQQVLANLLSNARKYSPDGGEIRLAVRVVKNMVEVSVRDHGLGIPPEALPRLFGKFFRVDNSDRRAIKGTGLGLAICRQIIDAHGGEIWAESAGLGKGARFCFTLPLVERETPHGAVLVVEDDDGFARLLGAELALYGLGVVWAGTAKTALEIAAAEPVRAMVIDLLLPDLPGEVLLARFQESLEPDLPRVVVTVKDLSPEEYRALMELGVVAVLRKEPGVAPRAAEVIAGALGASAELETE